MSDQPAPLAEEPEAKRLAMGIVDAATVVAGEIALESGPYDAGYRAVQALALTTLSPLQQHLPTLPASPGREKIREALARCNTDILVPLLNAASQSDKRIATPFAREAEAACIAIRNGLCEHFGIPLPKRQPPGARLNGSFAIVVVDLARYTRKIEVLKAAHPVVGDEGLLEVIELVNQPIRVHLSEAVASLGNEYRLADCVVRYTGDGAVLYFTSVTLAVSFARRLHEIAIAYNSRRLLAEEHHFKYRVGISFGAVKFVVTLANSWQVETTGLPLIEAARMECGSPAGGIAIFKRAWDRLCVELAPAPPPTDFAACPEHPTKNDEKYHAFVLGLTPSETPATDP